MGFWAARMADMELLAQKVVTSSAPVVVRVYHWGNIAVAASGALFVLLMVALVVISIAANFSQKKGQANADRPA